MQCEFTNHSYPSLLSEWRNLLVKRRAAEASLRSFFSELERRLTLLAQVLWMVVCCSLRSRWQR